MTGKTISPQVVIITGMHRSGTSLTAGVLQNAGVNIGRNLIEPNQGNQHGYFEDADFNRFQWHWLKRLGQSYLVQDKSVLGPPTAAEIKTVQALIEQRQNLSLWGWKNPRTTLFLEFWNSLLPQASYILVFRHPLEVVLSLLRRAMSIDLEVLTTPSAALRSWQVYNQCILEFYRQHPDRCLLVEINSVVADISGFITCAAQKLSLPLQPQHTETLYRPNELNRLSLTSEVLTEFAQLAPVAARLYYQLQQQADLPGRQLLPPISPAPPVRATGSDLDPLVLLLARLDLSTVLKSRVALDQHRVAQIDKLEQQLAKLRAETEQLEQRILYQQAELNKIQQKSGQTVQPLAGQPARTRSLADRLKAIYRTRAWRLAQKWYAFKRYWQ